MRRLLLFVVTAAGLVLQACGSRASAPSQASLLKQPIEVSLDLKEPSKSTGVFATQVGNTTTFKVGYGRNGVTCAGTRFEEGYTPLGRFKVNAILSNERFLMDPALVKQSGKSEAELKQKLFKSMNAIDFDGDQQIGEYGIGYISLAPVGSIKQPFAFNTYDGKFRWYSFAIHGSNNDKRIGMRVTGGCLNVSEPVLRQLLAVVKLGDEVLISANGPCTP
ncbi:MAG: L,D-transpeptidase [Prochlorococcaceae cyanobacterium]